MALFNVCLSSVWESRRHFSVDEFNRDAARTSQFALFRDLAFASYTSVPEGMILGDTHIIYVA